MEIFTIGFTKRSAEDFFEKIKRAGIGRVVDIRLNNRSQLAGFSKSRDLQYFLRELCGTTYTHEPLLTPTQEDLRAYQSRKISWDAYAERYVALLRGRHVEAVLDKSAFRVPTVLLCSEYSPEKCHRRLAVEYLKEKWANIKVSHL